LKLDNKLALVLGDFVEQSLANTSVGIIGVKSGHLLYVKVAARRSTNKVRLVDESFKPVGGKYRVILHFKTDK